MSENGTQKKNGTPKSISTNGFKLDQSLSMSARISSYLDWAAKTYPGVFTPYNQLLKAVMGYSYTPRMGNKEVADLRKKLSYARKMLQAEYKRDMVLERDLGARATFNDADALTVALPKRVARVRSATAAMEMTVSLINPDKVPDTEAYRPWKKWLKTDVREVLKLANSVETAHKALPAPKEA